MSRDILSGLPDATRGEILSFMTFFKGERARTLEALDGDFEDCLEDRIRGVDPPFSLEDVTSAVDHLQVVVTGMMFFSLSLPGFLWRTGKWRML